MLYTFMPYILLVFLANMKTLFPDSPFKITKLYPYLCFAIRSKVYHLGNKPKKGESPDPNFFFQDFREPCSIIYYSFDHQKW